MSDSGVKIELHIIQNFAPSNLNRDDTGQPKSAYFGAFRRARVSSQCGKRAVREWWRERGTVSVGERTKRLQQLIRSKLVEDEEFMKKGVEDGELRAGIRVFTDAYYAAADKKRPEKTNVLVFISPDEVDACAKAVNLLWEDSKKDATKKGQKSTKTVEGIASVVKKRLKLDRDTATEEASDDKDDSAATPEPEQVTEEESPEESAPKKKSKIPKLQPVEEIEGRIKAAQVSADIALFGRMLAEQPQRNTDGACQVAHPISTHKVDMEMDFYTAVDDLNPGEETGAGMMGVVGFNSACYYRYALVDRDQLARNLARKTARNNGEWTQNLEQTDYQEADRVIEAFLEAMVYAIPTGKKSSFAAQNLPSFGLFVRRQKGVPISLANAFAKPVRPTKNDDDLVGLSVDALTKHWDAMKKVYGRQGETTTACFHVAQGARLNDLSDSVKESVQEAIKAVLEDKEGTK